MSSATTAGGSQPAAGSEAGTRAVPPDWRPIPFREFVLKVHARCNLACDYCYMYELADQSWRNASKLMSDRDSHNGCWFVKNIEVIHQLPRTGTWQPCIGM